MDNEMVDRVRKDVTLVLEFLARAKTILTYLDEKDHEAVQVQIDEANVSGDSAAVCKILLDADYPVHPSLCAVNFSIDVLNMLIRDVEEETAHDDHDGQGA